MNKLFLSMLSFFFVISSHAQSVGVNDVPASENTTIEISKGKKQDRDFEIVEDHADLEGEASPLLKNAKKEWKLACKEWKDEVKELNKANSVISLNCGKMDCQTVNMETVCRSKATSKVKVPIVR